MKVYVTYMLDEYAEEHNRMHQRYECWIRWKPVEELDEHESIVCRGASFDEAEAKAVAMFRELPPSKEIEL